MRSDEGQPTLPIRITEGGCWEWTGALTRDGYALKKVAGRTRLAHRWVYEQTNGPVPTGLQLDHRCRVRRCVNPAHLEPVTPRENTIRGVGRTAMNAQKTVCRNGHPYDAENTIFRATGGRRCRACQRDMDARRRVSLP